MTKWIIGIIIILLLISGIIFWHPWNRAVVSDRNTPTAPNKDSKISQEVEFTPIAQGQYGGLNNKQNFVIKSDEEWKELDSKLRFHVKTPKVADFSKEMVIAVFMGQKTSGGYSIDVSKIIETEDKLTVTVSNTEPGPGCITTMALTEPYQVIKLKKINKSAEFKETTISKPCQ